MLLRVHYNDFCGNIVVPRSFAQFQYFFSNVRNVKLVLTGIEPVTSHMRSKRSTTELYTLCLKYRR